jgi:glycopeptide antibiotics resistance protein
VRRNSIPLWICWIPLIWLVSFPWTSLTRVPQWKRVHYVPLADPADKFRDVAANVLLFVPFGYSIGRRRGCAAGLLVAAGAAAVVSVSAEATQLFSTRRYPSATDVASACLGALTGVALQKLMLRRPQTI